MVQPYPSMSPEPAAPVARPERPRTVRAAVVLMYAGAVLNALAIVLTLVATHRIKTAIINRFPNYTATRVHNLEVITIVILVVPEIIAIGLWVWMAWANGRGRNWARVLSAVLFGLWTLYTVLALSRRGAGLGLIAVVFIWLIGLAALILIFLRESAPFYQRQPRY